MNDAFTRGRRPVAGSQPRNHRHRNPGLTAQQSGAAEPRSTGGDADRSDRRSPHQASPRKPTSAKCPLTAKWTPNKCPLPEHSTCASVPRRKQAAYAGWLPLTANRPRSSSGDFSKSSGVTMCRGIAGRTVCCEGVAVNGDRKLDISGNRKLDTLCLSSSPHAGCPEERGHPRRFTRVSSSSFLPCSIVSSSRRKSWS